MEFAAPAAARRWWSRAPLRRKVSAVAVVALLVAIPPVGLAAAFEIQLVDARSAVQAEQALLDDLHDLDAASSEATDAMLFYAIETFQDLQRLEDFERSAGEIPELAERLERALPDELQPQMAEVSSALDGQLEGLEAVVAFGDVLRAEQIEPEESLIDLFDASNAAVVTAREALADLETVLEDRVAAQRQEVSDLEGRVSRAVLASWIVVFVAVVGGSAVVTTSIVRRAERLTENGQRFLEGEPLLPTSPSDDELGELTGGVASIGALLNQRREEAVAATRVRDEFLARISQELRPPLVAIIERAETLQNEDLDADALEATHHVVRGGEHLLTLIDDLLDISRIETGELSISVEPVALRETVDETVALISSRAAARSIGVEVAVPRDLEVVADRHRLTQVLLNLLSNAVKYNRPAGRVEVAAVARAGVVRVSVSDTGFGIPPEGLSRLFRSFERLDAARTGVEGSGIGLALARHLVEAMGGTIGVESEVGQGSTFWVELPAAADSTSGAAPPVAVPATSGARPLDGEELPEHPSPARSDDISGTGSAVVAEEASGERRAWQLPRPESRRLRLWWQDMPIRRKILAFATVALLVSLPAVVLAAALELRLADVRSTTETIQDQLDDLNNLRDISAGTTNDVSFYVIGLFGGREPEQLQTHVDDFRNAAAESRELVVQLERDLPDDLAGQVEAMSSTLDAQLTAFNALVELEEIGVTGEDLTTVETFMVGGLAGAALREEIGDLRATLEGRLTAERQEVTDLEALVFRAVLASWFVTFGAVLGGAAIVVTGIVRRLERLSENGRRFITGEPLLPMGQSRDEVGQLTGGMVTVAGLLNQRRQEAIAATQVRDEFLSRISHELRTPLTAIIGFGEILEDELEEPGSRATARHILKGGERLLSLSDDLLDLSKVETGHLALAVEPVTLQEVVDEALSLVSPSATARSVTIDADVPAGLVVAADRDRLRQVLLNLLSNAVKFNRAGGRIGVAAGSEDGTIRTGITDTGRGISLEDQRRLFRPFERLGAAGTVATGAEGSGIGLALTKHLVEAMGGTIDVESGVDRGSTFWFTLPSAQALTAPAAPVVVRPERDEPDHLAERDTRPLVLCIDASTIDVARMEGIFRERPERLQVLPEGRSAPGLVRLLRPSLVLLASELPDTDGETVLRDLKAAPDIAGIPVVILTTDPGSHHIDLMLARGAMAVLPRPVNTARLREVLDSSLAMG